LGIESLLLCSLLFRRFDRGREVAVLIRSLKLGGGALRAASTGVWIIKSIKLHEELVVVVVVARGDRRDARVAE
jgi:hypothetical protein